jgi:hypothetical protein
MCGSPHGTTSERRGQRRFGLTCRIPNQLPLAAGFSGGFFGAVAPDSDEGKARHRLMPVSQGSDAAGTTKRLMVFHEPLALICTLQARLDAAGNLSPVAWTEPAGRRPALRRRRPRTTATGRSTAGACARSAQRGVVRRTACGDGTFPRAGRRRGVVEVRYRRAPRGPRGGRSAAGARRVPHMHLSRATPGT